MMIIGAVQQQDRNREPDLPADLTDIATVEFWIDGTSLTDKSGNGRNATANSAPETPTTGTFGTVPALLFNDDRVNVSGLPNDQILTYGFVGRHTGVETTSSVFGNTGTYIPLALQEGSAQSVMRINNVETPTGSRFLVDGEQLQTSATRSDAYDAISQQSLIMATVPAGNPVAWIGRGDDSDTNYFLNGQLAAAFVLSGALTADQINQIQGFCAHTYDWSLPSGHAYELSPPTMSDLA